MGARCSTATRKVLYEKGNGPSFFAFLVFYCGTPVRPLFAFSALSCGAFFRSRYLLPGLRGAVVPKSCAREPCATFAPSAPTFVSEATPRDHDRSRRT